MSTFRLETWHTGSNSESLARATARYDYHFIWQFDHGSMLASVAMPVKLRAPEGNPVRGPVFPVESLGSITLGGAGLGTPGGGRGGGTGGMADL